MFQYRIDLGANLAALLRPFRDQPPEIAPDNRLVTAYVYDLYARLSPRNHLADAQIQAEAPLLKHLLDDAPERT